MIIADDRVKRNMWKMGRVESLITGRDGMVRGATIHVICKGKPEFENKGLNSILHGSGPFGSGPISSWSDFSTTRLVRQYS